MAKKKVANSKAAKAKKSQTKTDAIRQALRSVKDGSPSEVAKVLNAKGIKVSAQYVSTIKAADKRRASSGAPRRKPGRPAGSGKSAAATSIATATHRNGDDLQQASDLMLHAVELVLKAGPSEARRLVTMAERMVDRIKA